uniref:RING-type domain-containing protein n=1 Tax=Vitis vinifera TaxID=29760 RepID=A5AGT9_VITVI|nr:hypothetical protein VITISV_009522 [Vitis vinifera]
MAAYRTNISRFRFLRINIIVKNVESAGCCYSNMMKDTHRCVERAMHHNCPVCFEFLFDTTKDITVLQCGHTIHWECVKEMQQHFCYSCPVCSKSICDMSSLWEKIDREVASTPMPEMYRKKMVWILCNDCGAQSEVQFHIVAHKCLSCKSYNTRQIQGGPASSCSSGIAGMKGMDKGTKQRHRKKLRRWLVWERYPRKRDKTGWSGKYFIY